jgi:hypothetical protein
VDRLALTGFGVIEEAWFLRCLKAVEAISPRISFRQSEAPPDIGAVARTEAVVQQAILFLTIDAGIPHLGLLPYRLPLIVLAKFLHLHPEPHVRSRLLLSRWVWRGALSAVHRDSSALALDGLLQLVDADEHASVERLLRSVPAGIGEIPDSSTHWTAKGAAARMCGVALLHLGARDPHTGRPRSVAEYQALVEGGGSPFHAIGPGRSTSVAQRLLGATGDDFTGLIPVPDGVLESHALTAAAVRALHERDWAAFASERSRVLDPWLDRFFRARSGAGELDRPPITELVRRADAAAAGQ